MEAFFSSWTQLADAYRYLNLLKGAQVLPKDRPHTDRPTLFGEYLAFRDDPAFPKTEIGRGKTGGQTPTPIFEPNLNSNLLLLTLKVDFVAFCGTLSVTEAAKPEISAPLGKIKGDLKKSLRELTASVGSLTSSTFSVFQPQLTFFFSILTDFCLNCSGTIKKLHIQPELFMLLLLATNLWAVTQESDVQAARLLARAVASLLAMGEGAQVSKTLETIAENVLYAAELTKELPKPAGARIFGKSNFKDLELVTSVEKFGLQIKPAEVEGRDYLVLAKRSLFTLHFLFGVITCLLESDRELLVAVKWANRLLRGKIFNQICLSPIESDHFNALLLKKIIKLSGDLVHRSPYFAQIYGEGIIDSLNKAALTSVRHFEVIQLPILEMLVPCIRFPELWEPCYQAARSLKVFQTASIAVQHLFEGSGFESKRRFDTKKDSQRVIFDSGTTVSLEIFVARTSEEKMKRLLCLTIRLCTFILKSFAHSRPNDLSELPDLSELLGGLKDLPISPDIVSKKSLKKACDILESLETSSENHLMCPSPDALGNSPDNHAHGMAIFQVPDHGSFGDASRQLAGDSNSSRTLKKVESSDNVDLSMGAKTPIISEYTFRKEDMVEEEAISFANFQNVSSLKGSVEDQLEPCDQRLPFGRSLKGAFSRSRSSCVSLNSSFEFTPELGRRENQNSELFLNFPSKKVKAKNILVRELPLEAIDHSLLEPKTPESSISKQGQTERPQDLSSEDNLPQIDLS
jgi:hypothetical protein